MAVAAIGRMCLVKALEDQGLLVFRDALAQVLYRDDDLSGRGRT